MTRPKVRTGGNRPKFSQKKNPEQLTNAMAEKIIPLVTEQIQSIFNMNASAAPNPRERLASKRRLSDDESDEDVDDDNSGAEAAGNVSGVATAGLSRSLPKKAKPADGSAGNDAGSAGNDAGNATASSRQQIEKKNPPEYSSQAVVLEGISDSIKKHPAKLSKAFVETKPNVQLRHGGLRLTASGDVLAIPKNPKDCCSLLKENAFPADCPLGPAVKARLPKSQTVTHQVIITRVDTEVTTEELDEILRLQEQPFKSFKRIHSRALEKPTEMIRLFLHDEKEKKRLLKEGINLDQMHYKCIPAKEDSKAYPKVNQCFKCQALGDHQANSCQNDQKCVLCAGPHRKAECKATREQYKCANCGGNHAAWSHDCERIANEINGKKKPTMAQVASATVTPAMLDSLTESIMEGVALIVAEVVSRCLCELTLEIVNKTLNKSNLPSKIDRISSSAAKATSGVKIASKQYAVSEEKVKEQVMAKCFAGQSSQPSSSQKVASSVNHG